MTRQAELSWVDENGGTFRFLDKQTSLSGFRTVFASFPRSGNSFLRRFLEQISGIHTGADVRVDGTLNLQMCGLIGEGHVGVDDVWICKSHFALDQELCKEFTANKAIILFRNPLDVIISYTHLQNMASHSLTCKERYDKEFPEYWEWFVRVVDEALRDFYHVNMARLATSIPTYIVRYEDVVENPLPVLKELFSFLLDTPDLTGTILEQRILKYGSTSTQSKAIYGLKSKSKRIPSRELYNDELFALIKKDLKHMIHFLDYQQEEGNPSKKTQFFPYTPEETKDVDLSFNYREFNKRSLAQIPNTEVKEFVVNQPGDKFRLFRGSIFKWQCVTEHLHIDEE
ncbi:hypothetical protein FGO68_gene573 [Halteria grandinella]|uniref:Sulfotransferase domain-containing protein n=1 Tax=Halteria grandinella TaxID=5974 RepID=A0A8J8NNA5_HALGN|nr:hypothetical protein FGO68_gene573 [Halteria grandinella]